MIVTAKRLVTAGAGKPRQADLRRAISTAYYAVFHAMAKDAADQLVGARAGRFDPTWARVYRGLQHGEARAVCETIRASTFSTPVKTCASSFVELQEQRHAADYDPTVTFTRSDARDAVAMAELAIRSLMTSSKAERLAFAVQLLHRRRR